MRVSLKKCGQENICK